MKSRGIQKVTGHEKCEFPYIRTFEDKQLAILGLEKKKKRDDEEDRDEYDFDEELDEMDYDIVDADDNNAMMAGDLPDQRRHNESNHSDGGDSYRGGDSRRNNNSGYNNRSSGANRQSYGRY